MNHERWHTIEKIQVEIAAVIALAAAYFVAWPAVHPADVDGIVVFLPIGAWGSLAALAAMVWALAILCAVFTLSARFEGAMTALLIGTAGLAFRTGPMRFLINRFESAPSELMRPLAMEVVVLAGILLVAAVIMRLVRLGLGRLCPRWMFPASSQEATDGAKLSPAGWLFGVGRAGDATRAHLLGVSGPGESKSGKAADGALVSIGSCFGMTLVIALLMLFVTLKSVGGTDRGQILFALASSFFVGALAGNYLFPSPTGAACWLAPLTLALVVYVKTGAVTPTPPLTWTTVDVFGHILPIDWFSAGCGGAAAGFWVSRRLHEVKQMAVAVAE